MPRLASKFRLIDETKVQLDFGVKTQVSEYLNALREMLKTPGRVMEVDSLTARSGINTQAKKHGITVLFAEKSGKLYVKVMGQAGPEQSVLKLLDDEGPRSVVEIGTALAKAHPGAVASEVIGTLSTSGKIVLRTVAGGSDKKWHRTIN